MQRVDQYDHHIEQSIQRIIKDASALDPMLADLRRWQDQPSRGELWLAIFNERAVGLALLEGTELKALRVHPATRGRGVGQRMLSLLLSEKPDMKVAFSCADEATLNWYTKIIGTGSPLLS